MAYDKFNILTSSAVPLSIENVDTDQIIPARFLKATTREGFGKNLISFTLYSGHSPETQGRKYTQKQVNVEIGLPGKAKTTFPSGRVATNSGLPGF
mgnify:CR=1 FL=1